MKRPRRKCENSQNEFGFEKFNYNVIDSFYSVKIR